MRPASVVTALVGVVLLLGACAGGASDDWSINAIADPDAEIEPVLVTSRVGVGETRLAFALFDRERNLIDGATDGELHLYSIDGDTGTLEGEHELRAARLTGEGTPHEHADEGTHLHDGPTTTVYAGTVQLTQPGWWGAELRFRLDGRDLQLRYRFSIAESTNEPAVGEPVPPSRQLLLSDVDDIALVDTSIAPVPELHELTIAEAIASGRPSVIAFATPLFCQTRFCGPVVEQIVVPVWERYGDRVNVLQVEPYEVPAARAGTLVPVETMIEWRLQTEPWVFVVDADGLVVAKFEGIMGLDEVNEAVERAFREAQ